MSTEIVYDGRDNTIELTLLQDGSAYNITTLTRVDLILDATTTITGASSGTPFDWTTQGANGVLVMTLGGESIDAGTYTGVRLVVYDASNTNGIVWVDDLSIKVKE